MTLDTRPRWGLGAFWAAWFAGLFAAIVGTAIGIGLIGRDVDSDDPGLLLVSLLAQASGVVLAVWIISRTRGQGSLRADFGLEVRGHDLPWLLIGIGLQVGAAILLLPLSVLGPDQAQGVVEGFEDARGDATIAVFAFAVVALAPVVEELLFRGLLLRALLRRTTAGAAVLWSAGIFAGIHVVLDPSVGSAQALPALVALGILSADQAVRTRSLSRSILLHAGFNLLTAVQILVL